MRNKYDQQLGLLNDDMIKMGSLCEEVISKAAKCLCDNNPALIKEVIETDKQIDDMEHEIESICMKLILRQQPVATDLRMISSALKMISDMERIGDQAADIAEILKFIGVGEAKSKLHICDMARATIKMVTESVESYVKRDYDMAKAVIAYDDKVDSLFIKVKEELTELIKTEKVSGEFCLDLLMIAKYFERIGDHAVNIAGWVLYSLTGTHKE